MTSRKKLGIALLCLILIILVVLYFIFFSKKSEIAPTETQNQDNCALFQSLDAKKPCYIENNAKPGTTTTLPDSSITGGSSTGSLSFTDKLLLVSCTSPDQQTSDECVKKVAVENKKPALCSGIQSTLNKVDCISSVGRVEKPTTEIFSKPTVNQDALKTDSFSNNQLISPRVSTSSAQASSWFNNLLEDMKQSAADTRANPDPNYTADGFYQRLAASQGITLYAFSEYQVAPGTTITAQGVGFTKTGNTLYLGTYSISGLESSDGTTVSFTVPSLNVGTYEGWVENTNGSSRKEDRKVMLMITNSPTPKPVIRSISPALPSDADTVTFSGENFSSMVNVATTFGNKEAVSATGGTFTLKPSDLTFYDKVKNAPGIKGSKVSFFIYVYNENGVSGQPFTFDIQF
ncbi:MAG: hypothetical protein RLZZ67_39 [Candidatus Parcubacteria bacterium]|jgi:hypothetical protein